ncbi:minor capsid protein [Oenococcus oeni]|uniref:Phage head morphogenesis protein n=1 Tax=Oenococcus oeni TaxID=1247 RepID=A0AAJ2UBF0_OENOE|nr:minor capsid protein [Oenococcus oeni]MDV7715276.1 phage head morphogenesis protein [Oenococcus oeni]
MTDKDKLTYWELRAVRNEQKAHDQANDKVNVITNAYLRSQDYLTNQVDNIYKRYFGEGQFTEEQIKDILNTTVSPSELVTLQALAKNISDPQSKKQIVDYLSALAAKGRITRLEEIKAKTYISVKRAANIELKESTNLYTQVIQEAWNQATAEGIIGDVTKDVQLYEKGYVPEVDKTNRMIKIVNPNTGKTITKVKAIPDKEIKSFKQLSDSYVKKALNQRWQGKNYSQRIWNNTDALADKLDELFTAQSMSGMSEYDMARAIEKEFGTGIYNAKRLIRTEANYFHNQTKLDGWKEHKVKEYQLVAVLDNRTSQICRKKDGQVFLVKDAKCDGAEGNYPPFHVFCRTVAVIHFANSPYTGTRTANNPNTKTAFQLKQNKTYQDWEEIINQSK